MSRSPLDDCLKSFIRPIVQVVLAECGQATAPMLYDAYQATEILKVPKRWLYAQTSAGTIPRQKLGKFIRFTDEDLRAIIGGRS